MDNGEKYYLVEENLSWAERGAYVSPVSLSSQISLGFLPGLVPGGCGCCLLVCFVFRSFFFSGKFVFTINSSC